MIETALGHNNRVTVSDNYDALHSDLINRGFTCDSQDYGDDDSVTGARFRHTLNDHLVASIRLTTD
jgi:hypothetical protein